MEPFSTRLLTVQGPRDACRVFWGRRGRRVNTDHARWFVFCKIRVGQCESREASKAHGDESRPARDHVPAVGMCVILFFLISKVDTSGSYVFNLVRCQCLSGEMTPNVAIDYLGHDIQWQLSKQGSISIILTRSDGFFYGCPFIFAERISFHCSIPLLTSFSRRRRGSRRANAVHHAHMKRPTTMATYGWPVTLARAGRSCESESERVKPPPKRTHRPAGTAVRIVRPIALQSSSFFVRDQVHTLRLCQHANRYEGHPLCSRAPQIDRIYSEGQQGNRLEPLVKQGGQSGQKNHQIRPKASRRQATGHCLQRAARRHCFVRRGGPSRAAVQRTARLWPQGEGSRNMRVDIVHESPVYDSYRAARTRSLFNCEDGHRFVLSADLPDPTGKWQIGVIVGPSGSGKTSIGRTYLGGEAFHDGHDWPTDRPIIDAIAPGAPYEKVTAALTAVGLSSVPAWMRPYQVLSTGEKFRADLARIMADTPNRVVIDEFTSVIDRQVAMIGATAFAKAWRRTDGRVVLLSCHYDILDWLSPDWIFDTATGRLVEPRGCERPSIDLDIHQTNWRFWHLFEPHHYLRLPYMVAATNYVGTVNGTLVAHCAVSTLAGMKQARMARIVVMPDWQGVGVGMRFIEAVSALWVAGKNRYGKPMPMTLNTSHPGLARAFRANPNWIQLSQRLYGSNKKKSVEKLKASAAKGNNNAWGAATGFGGHFRAIQGFKYVKGLPT